MEPADHIVDNVYLGSEKSAIDLDFLKANNIDRIIIAAAFCEPTFNKEKDGIDYMILNIDDSPQEQIIDHFEKCFEFIEKDKDRNVLIHCISGISRSGSIVIAYTMKSKKVSFKEAWNFVKDKRNVVYPNSGF